MKGDDSDDDPAKIRPLSDEELAALKKKIELENRQNAPIRKAKPRAPTTVGVPGFIAALALSIVAVLIIMNIGKAAYLPVFGTASVLAAIILYALLWVPKYKNSLTAMLFVFFCINCAALLAGIFSTILMAIIAYFALRIKGDV